MTETTDNMPATRSEATALCKNRYFTGRPCKRGHIAARRTGCGTCIECSAVMVRKWQDANPAKVKTASRKWYSDNPEKARKKTKDWHSANREKIREMSRSYRAHNSEKMNSLRRAWEVANPAKKNAINAKRRAAKRNATPAWANSDDILVFYEESARLTVETGVAHHVDHIIPLQSNTVCGLHVACNLRVITMAENLAKKNSYSTDNNVPITEAGKNDNAG